jgi:hypothetical protein
MSRRSPFHAVRIVVVTDDASSYQRDYVRPDYSNMGIARFNAWALGDMLLLVTGAPLNEPVTVTSFGVHEVTFEQVRQNRRYHHTTHTEG